MPRYKVQASDGKVLTIEAPDESALDEAMSEYEGGLQTQAPAPAAQPQEKGWGETFMSQLPFGQTALNLGAGKDAYGKGAEGLAQGAGDIGAAAGIGAAAASLGAAPVVGGALLGAGIGTLGEKTGAYDWMRNKAQELRGEGLQSGESPSVAKNLLGMMGQYVTSPRQMAATGVELFPAATTALASLGLAKAAPKVIGAAAAGPKPLPAGAAMLEDAGVKVTPAMTRFAETGARTGLPTAVENVAKTNPFTAAGQEANQAAASAAVKAKVAGIPGAQLTKQGAGDLLSSVMEKFQGRRGAAVGSAKDALRKLDAGDVGKTASNRIIAQLEKGGVPAGEAGFDASLMRGREQMARPVAEALIQAERDLRGATLGEAINYLENFDSTFGADLSAKYGNSATNAVKEARNLIKTSIVEAAGKADPQLAKALTGADRAYSISQPTAKKFLTSARGDTAAVDLPGKLFGRAGAKGDRSLARLKKTMTPQEFGDVQDALASSILERAGGVENMSLPKLRSALRELGENKQYLKPGVIKQLEDAALMMETAQVAELGVPNPSGTGTRLLQASMTSPVGLIPAAATAPFIKGYQALPGAIRGAQSMIAPTAKALSPAVARGLNPTAVPATFVQALNASNRR